MASMKDNAFSVRSVFLRCYGRDPPDVKTTKQCYRKFEETAARLIGIMRVSENPRVSSQEESGNVEVNRHCGILRRKVIGP